jgi:hypothetical protein
MNTIRRRSRAKREADPIGAAWDAGLPPPPEAFQPESRDLVIDTYFFREWEHPRQWEGRHHPHNAEWRDAMRAPGSAGVE